MKLMINKLSILFFFLIFLNSFKLFSNNISEFAIEGISVGDSLLDYFTIEEIKDNTIETSYVNKKYKKIEFYKYDFFKKYEALQFYVLSNDKKFIIYSIAGAIFYDDITICNNDRNEIINDIKNIFDDTVKLDIRNAQSHSQDPTGKSLVYSAYFDFLLGHEVHVRCVDWSAKIENDYGWSDNLAIYIKTKEFVDWLEYFSDKE